ncbi:MAG: choice-of-anchor J domain-containing protein [Sphingobacteriaceae bacterium]
MKKILRTLILLVLTVGFAKAQVYLTEGFENPFTGNPAAPSGWTQTRLVLLGDGIPDVGTGEKDWERITNISPTIWSHSWSTPGTQPLSAKTGSAVLAINNANFGGTTAALGNRRMETPVVNLASSTNPYVRFFMFSGMSNIYNHVRVVASNDGGTTWQYISQLAPGQGSATALSSNSPWDRINVKIPAAFKVSNAKFAIEITNLGFTGNYYIDDFTIEEFTPTTITSAATGNWASPATWVGGIVPTADNHVVIAATHTITSDHVTARMQDLSISATAVFQYTSSTAIAQVFGDLTVASTGTFFSGNGVTGRKSYFGGNIINNGVLNFQPGTSTTGALNWVGYAQTYSGTGTLFNNRVPQVGHFASGGVQYLSAFKISNYLGLYAGTVDATNLTLGGGPAAAIFQTDRTIGSFINTPTFDNANVTQRSLAYVTPLTTANPGGYYFAHPATNLNPGTEIPSVSSSFSVTGTLQMNTYNNVTLTTSLTVGTPTGGGLTLSRGIITTSNSNLLVINNFIAGPFGVAPSTIVCNGTNFGGTHGSYINGPLRINFPTTGTANRNFALGVGNAFHNNLASSNILRTVTVGSGLVAWGGQTITATIENAPSGTFNTPITAVLGSRAYRLNFNGGPGLPANAFVTLNANNSTFGGSDNLLGNLQDLRIVQASSLTGPWNERSLTAGLGPVLNNTPLTRSTVSATPGPINNGDEYFAWGSAGNVVDITASGFTSPAPAGCYGNNQTVAVSLLNSGLATINFATNPATVNAVVSGAVNFTFAPVVINSGTLAASASQTVVISNTFNMSTIGNYAFDGTVTTTGDNNTTNDIYTTINRTVTAPVGLPLQVDFSNFNGTNLTTLFPGWTEAAGTTPSVSGSNWASQVGISVPTNTTSRLNLWDVNQNAWIISPKFTAAIGSQVTFDAALSAWNSTVNTGVLGSDDMLRVMVSTDCGATYVPIFTINASTNLNLNFTNFIVPLGAYNGQDIIVAFYGNDGPINDIPDMDIHIDNINIYNLPAFDAGISALTSPSTAGCYSNNEPVNVTLKNFGANSITNVPVTVIVSGAVSQTLNTVYTGTLSSSASVAVNVGNLNMSTAGLYNFKSFSSLPGDNIPTNDTNVTSRTVLPTYTLPLINGFNSFNGSNLPTAYIGWKEAQGATAPGTGTVSNWGSAVGLGAPTNTTSRVQLFGNTYREWIVGPKFVATASTQVTFDAAVTDFQAVPGPSVMGSDDRLLVYVSNNCGASYTPIFTISATNSLAPTFSNFAVSLSAYSGQELIVAFQANDGTIDDPESYYLHLDNINIYNIPNQDGGITAITNPAATGCYGTNENVQATLKNFGSAAISNVPVSVVVSGAVNQTLTTTFAGPLAPLATVAVNVGTLNMSTAGTYSFNAFTSVVGDGFVFNDSTKTTRNSLQTYTIPMVNGFDGFTGANLPTVYSGWRESQGATAPNTGTVSNWASQIGLSVPTNTNARVQLFGNTYREWIIGPKFTATVNTQVTFDAALTGNTTAPFTPSVMGSDDKVMVFVSTDCGVNFTPIYTISATNSLTPTYSNFAVSLSAYSGQDIMVAFQANDGTIDDPESYFFHLDNINIYNQPNQDAGITAHTSPTTTGCFGPAETVIVTLKNHGAQNITNVPVTVWVSGATAATLNTTYTGTLAPQATVAITAGTLNMTAGGTYSFNSFTSLIGDGYALNDTLKTTRFMVPLYPTPQVVNFTGFNGGNINTLFPGWAEGTGTAVPTSTTSNWTSQTGLNGPTNITARLNLWLATTAAWLISPKVAINANSQLTFDAALTQYASTTASATLGNDDMVRVMVSTDCGLSYSPIFTINATNSLSTTFTNFTVSLAPYAGQEIMIAFFGTDGPVDEAPDNDFHLDNINITTPYGNDVGATALVNPGPAGCYSASEPVNVEIKNFGVNTQTSVPVTVIVSGALTQTLTGTYTGTLLSGQTATFGIGFINMSAFGTYSFNAFTGLIGDNQVLNDALTSIATRTNVAPIALPYSQNFNATLTLPTGFTSTNYNVMANHGANYNNNAMAVNLWSTSSTVAIVTMPKMGTVTATSSLKYDYRIQDWSGYPSSAATSTANWANDSLNVYVSVDCGLTYSLVQSNNASNHTPTVSLTTKTVNLAPYAGNNIIVRFIAKKDPAGFGDYYVDLDNINVCAGPPNAPVATSTVICTSNSVALTANGTGTLSWYATPSATSAIGSGTLFNTPTLTTTTSFYVKDSTVCGNSNLTTVNVTVSPTPTLNAVANNSAICIGSTATLTASGMDTYTWSTASNNTVIVVTPTTATSYTVSGYSTLCMLTQTTTVSLGVNPLPSVSLTAGASTICAGNGSISLTGLPPGGAYSGSSITGSLLSIANPGTFVPVYTFTNSTTGCSNSASTTVIVANCTDVQTIAGNTSTINIYPNPNNGSFVIETTNVEEKLIEVTDLTGRVVFSEKTTNQSIKVNIYELANGLYQIKIKSESETHQFKVIKQ